MSVARPLLFAAVLLAACAPLMSTPPGAPPPSPPASSPVPPEAQIAVALALQDLARTLNLPRDRIHVLSVAPTTWPDASLGCPQPGTLYAQVLTPGYRVILTDGQRRYEYHTDGGQRAVRCS